MSWKPLTPTSSIVTVPTSGQPVQFINTHKSAQSVLVQALPLNLGRVVVGYDNTVRAGSISVNPSGTVLAIIGAPLTNVSTPPSANGGNPTAPGAIDLQQFWIDVSNSGEGVIVSYIV